MTLEDFIQQYNISLVQGHVTHLLRQWSAAKRLLLDDGRPIAQLQGRQWYVMEPDALNELVANRHKKEEDLTPSGRWRRRKAQQQKQEEALKRLVRNYARRHQLSAADIRNTPRLFEAATLEQDVRDGHLTVAQARRRLMLAFHETKEPGKTFVSHYIGGCKGECTDAERCPYERKIDLSQLVQ